MFLNFRVGLVLFSVWTFGESLKCSAGIVFEGQDKALGATVECSNDNPQCVEMRGGSREGYGFYFCMSLRVAGNEYYGANFACGNNSAYSVIPCQSFCSSDNCNTNLMGYAPFPPTEVSSTPIQCYNGIADVGSGYLLRGGFDYCDGLCVSYTYYGNKTRVFGCAPYELPPQLGATDSGCTGTGDLTVCFCGDDLCNNNFSPYPEIKGNLSCYSGIKAYNEYYGSVEVCQPDEVCAGFVYGGGLQGYPTVYQCMRQDACFSYWGKDQQNVSASCQWGFGNLAYSCCCADNLCNFNAGVMAPAGVVPTPNPATNNNELTCLDAIQYNDPSMPNSPIAGSLRSCSGACAFVDIARNFNQWRCIDADVCTALNVSMGTCVHSYLGMDTFCCFANATTTPMPSQTPGSGSCPEGWKKSQTVPGKCYWSPKVQETFSWSDAQQMCQNLDPRASLISVRNGFENSEVADEFFSGGSLWTGLYWTEGFWAWADTRNVSYTNWAPGEPLRPNTCARLERARGLWFAEDCSIMNDLVCELYV